MNTNELAEFLIESMQWTMGFKTAVFLVLAIFLGIQGWYSKLGKWTNIHFAFHFLMSSVFTVLVSYLDNEYILGNIEHYEFSEWFLIVSLNVGPIILSLTGIMMVRWMLAAETQVLERRSTDLDVRELMADKRESESSGSFRDIKTLRPLHSRQAKKFRLGRPEEKGE